MKTFMQIGLATSEEIQSWAERSFLINGKTYSIGEVKKADTINYRSFKPEKDGLFCERIFGPVKDWICGCGQSRLKTLKNEKKGTGDRSTPLTPQYPYLFPELKFSTKTFDYGFKDEQGKEKNDERVAGNSPSTGLFICPNCQVEVTLSRVRRYRMGYIELGCPVTHIWYLNSRPNIFSVLLKIPTKYVKKITYYRGYSPTVLSSGFDEINPRNFTQKQVLQIRSPAGSSGEATGDFPGGGPPFPSVSLAPGVFGSENPCIAPGGDFFDNEWEFLHIWFSLPRTTQQYYKVGGAKGIGFSISENSVGSQIEKPMYPPTFSPSLSTSPQGVKETTGNLNSLFSTAKDEQPSVFPELPEFNNRSNGSVQREKQEGKGLTTLTSPKLWKDKNTSQKPIRLVSSIPSWLENTGAKAFKQHFENRDWQKEFEKLHEDLRRTPIFFNEMPGGGGKPLRYPAETSGLSVKSEFPRERVPPKTDPDPLQGGKVSPAPNHFLIYDNLLKRRKKRVRNLKLLNALRTAGGTKAFDGFIFQILPVLPPELRPIVQLSAGQFASSDVNDLYRRLISRNNRLKYYFTACGPHLVEFLVRSEQHLVQVAVDALFDGSSAASELGNLRRGGGTLSGSNATSGSKGSSSNAGVYKSLSDRIGGKQGRFRQNLLGKRVDYSGRSVIVVGPRLKLHECGLPYEMAIELFQAFILRHILELQLAKTIRGAKNLIKLNKPFARQILQNIIEAHPILLNRAPTLHRLGIQAFQPKLISGKAIQLHPLVCAAFNADFDGDQMAVHVPLSPKSRVEARLLMLATTNWLSAATGQPSILPSQDMVLGFYYLTTVQKNIGSGPRALSNTGPGGEVPLLAPQTSAILGSISSMTQILAAGPAQRNELNIHEPVWLTKKKLWPHEKTYFVSQVLSNKETPKGFEADPRLSNAGKTKLQKTFAATASSLLKFETKGVKSFESGTGKGARDTPEFRSPPQNFEKLSFSGIEGGKNTFYEPLVLKIFQSGFANQVYHSYKWTQNSAEDRSNRSLRTTAGRVLVNEILEKLAYTGGKGPVT